MGLVTCRECGRIGISDLAASCPNCARPMNTGQNSQEVVKSNGGVFGARGKYINALIIAALAIAFISAMPERETEKDRAARLAQEDYDKNCEHGDIEAWSWSTIRVADNLKSPSTAVFPSASEANIFKQAPCRYKVRSYVDSQNAFGAIVRVKYSIIMEYNPKDKAWAGSYLDLRE